MKAMILCAGLGTRLRPVTGVWPKPAMPLLGQPLFRYALATLVRAGIRQVGINTHHLPQVMRSVAEKECARAGVSLFVVDEAGEIQGTGGGIRGLRSFLSSGGSEFVVMNGDVLFGLELGPVIAAHRASGASATMVLLPMPEGEKFNPVEVTQGGDVRRIAGQGPGGGGVLLPWHFSGVHVMTPAVFDFMAPSGAEDINRDVYVRMINAGLRVHGHTSLQGQVEGGAPGVYWSDLGTPARYAVTHQQLLFGQVPMGPFGEASPFLPPVSKVQGANFFAHSTSVLRDARVAGPAWFGEGCELGDGVRIGAAVSVGPGAKVGSGAMLNRVAVLDGAEVFGGALLEDCIVAPGGIILGDRLRFG